MKFAIGQHVCHPLYGPGQIVDIDEQAVESSPQAYYVIRILGQNLTTRIPLDAIDKVGLRSIISKKQTQKVIATLQQDPVSLPADPNRRKMLLKSLIFSGKPVKIAEAIRELTWRRLRRGSLTVSDKKLLNQGTEMLVAEVAVATDEEQVSVLASVDKALRSALEEKTNAAQ